VAPAVPQVAEEGGCAEVDQEKGGAQQPEGPVAEAHFPFHQRAQGGDEIAVHILQKVEAGEDNEGPGGEGQGGIPQLIKPVAPASRPCLSRGMFRN